MLVCPENHRGVTPQNPKKTLYSQTRLSGCEDWRILKTDGIGGGEDKQEIITPLRNVVCLQNIATTDLNHCQDKPGGGG